MSWEPLFPMGFSPCGTPFGVLEGPAYSAPAKFFANGGFPNRIYWYRVPDDRPFYDGLTSFVPRRDDQYDASGQEMETTGHKPNPRKFYSGRDQWFLDGTHVHGDAQDFLGLSNFEKYSGSGRLSEGPCGEPTHIFECLALLSALNPVRDVIEVISEGLRLGCAVIEDFIYEGIAFDDVVVDVPPTAEALAQGVRLGQVVVDVEPSIVGDVAGVQLGQVVVDLPPVFPIEELAQGVQLGQIVVDVAVPIEEVAQGVQLGQLVVDVVEPIEELAQGVQLGQAVVDLPPVFPIEQLAQGVQLGQTVVDVEPSIAAQAQGVQLGQIVLDVEPSLDQPADGVQLGQTVVDVSVLTPGATCAAAPEVTLGTAYTFNIAPMEIQWFKFAVAASTQYHVRLVKNSGGSISASVETGSSCASTTLEFALDGNFFVCNTFTKGSVTTCFVHVSGPFSGTTNYTITMDTGPC